MTKYLVQHTLPPAEYAEGIEIGQRFEVIREDEVDYEIVQNGIEMLFGKEPDYEGDSYATWFTVEEER